MLPTTVLSDESLASIPLSPRFTDSVKLTDGILDCLPQPDDATSPSPEPLVEVSLLILAKDEEENIKEVLSAAVAELRTLGVTHELVVVDGHSKDKTAELAVNLGALVLRQSEPGYAAALVEGLQKVSGRLVITLDADCSHPPALLGRLLELSKSNRIVVGSRWMTGGSFSGSPLRGTLSRLLSTIFRWVLKLPVKDISSGYRLYHREILTPRKYAGRDFSVLQEILVRALSEGHSVCETPLQYAERKHGKSHVSLARFALSYARTLGRMWMIRSDAGSCDYDSRAYDSWNLVQRFWQRRRYKNIMGLLGEYRTTGSLLDIGCGSSRIIQNLPHAVAFDASFSKLRGLVCTNKRRVRGSAISLPFADESFDCLIHSQLIEHLQMVPEIFSEMNRVLKVGGTAIVGTVDYGAPWWPIIETIYGILMPHAYADEHISHYTLASLQAILRDNGFEIESVRTILKGEITIKARKK
jgi:dolichol-phosphate mannosyltransferase